MPGFHVLAEDLEAAESLALVVHPGTAVVVDMAAATRLGIPVMHFPGVNSQSVAEHTMALILDLAKGITQSDGEVRRGSAWATGDHHLMRTELYGKVLGLVGFGNAGAAVARIAGAGFGMRVRVWSRSQPESVEWEPDLDRLLATADVVSLHLALNPETRNLIDRRRIGLLQPHVLVINTARVALLDLEALADALTAGRIAGAGFDVWPRDQPDMGFLLLKTPNTVLTQHNAGLTGEAAARAMKAVLDCVEAFLTSDEPPPGRMANPEVWPRRRRLSRTGRRS